MLHHQFLSLSRSRARVLGQPRVQNILLCTIRSFTTQKSDPNKKYWIRPESRTIPNMITASRILSSPILAWAIMNDYKAVALGGCVLFGFSDWLDGYLAKKLNQQTVLGAFLDPLADKFMIGSIAIGLMYKELLPVPLVGLIIFRDVFLVSCAMILRGIHKAPDEEYFDASQSKIVIKPSLMSKINTVTQFSLLGITLCNYTFGTPGIEYLEPLWWFTASTTVISGLGYLDGSGVAQTMKAKFRKPSQ